MVNGFAKIIILLLIINTYSGIYIPPLIASNPDTGEELEYFATYSDYITNPVGSIIDVFTETGIVKIKLSSKKEVEPWMEKVIYGKKSFTGLKSIEGYPQIISNVTNTTWQRVAILDSGVEANSPVSQSLVQMIDFAGHKIEVKGDQENFVYDFDGHGTAISQLIMMDSYYRDLEIDLSAGEEINFFLKKDSRVLFSSDSTVNLESSDGSYNSIITNELQVGLVNGWYNISSDVDSLVYITFEKELISTSLFGEFIMLKVLDDSGKTNTETVLIAIEWLLSNYQRYNISIINMSFNFNEFSPIIEASLHKLEDQGLIIVASGGNNPSEIQFPGGIDHVITAVPENQIVVNKTVGVIVHPDLFRFNGRDTSIKSSSIATALMTSTIFRVIASLEEKGFWTDASDRATFVLNYIKVIKPDQSLNYKSLSESWPLSEGKAVNEIRSVFSSQYVETFKANISDLHRIDLVSDNEIFVAMYEMNSLFLDSPINPILSIRGVNQSAEVELIENRIYILKVSSLSNEFGFIIKEYALKAYFDLLSPTGNFTNKRNQTLDFISSSLVARLNLNGVNQDVIIGSEVEFITGINKLNFTVSDYFGIEKQFNYSIIFDEVPPNISSNISSIAGKTILNSFTLEYNYIDNYSFGRVELLINNDLILTKYSNDSLITVDLLYISSGDKIVSIIFYDSAGNSVGDLANTTFAHPTFLVPNPDRSLEFGDNFIEFWQAESTIPLTGEIFIDEIRFEIDWTGNNISWPINYQDLGGYNLTLVLRYGTLELGSKLLLDQVIVNIVDTINPSISVLSPIKLDITDNEDIIIEIFDVTLSSILITINNSQVLNIQNINSSSFRFQYSINGSLGTWIRVFIEVKDGEDNNYAIRREFNWWDLTAPLILSMPERSFLIPVNEQLLLEWFVEEKFMDFVVININDKQIQLDNILTNRISYLIDDLPPGSYQIEMIAFDIGGNYVNDTILIEVTQPKISTSFERRIRGYMILIVVIAYYLFSNWLSQYKRTDES